MLLTPSVVATVETPAHVETPYVEPVSVYVEAPPAPALQPLPEIQTPAIVEAHVPAVEYGTPALEYGPPAVEQVILDFYSNIYFSLENSN